MKAKRRHDRVPLMADVTIQPGQEDSARFGGAVFNVSRGGMAVFTEYFFPPGRLVSLELILPVEGDGLRGITLYGVTRWILVDAGGNTLGIELLTDPKAGDYAWFDEHFDLYVGSHGRSRESAK